MPGAGTCCAGAWRDTHARLGARALQAGQERGLQAAGNVVQLAQRAVVRAQRSLLEGVQPALLLAQAVGQQGRLDQAVDVAAVRLEAGLQLPLGLC